MRPTWLHHPPFETVLISGWRDFSEQASLQRRKILTFKQHLNWNVSWINYMYFTPRGDTDSLRTDHTEHVFLPCANIFFYFKWENRALSYSWGLKAFVESWQNCQSSTRINQSTVNLIILQNPFITITGTQKNNYLCWGGHILCMIVCSISQKLVDRLPLNSEVLRPWNDWFCLDGDLDLGFLSWNNYPI